MGIRYCDTCNPQRRRHNQILACERCGGEKVGGMGRRYCDACRVAATEDIAQKSRDRASAYYNERKNDADFKEKRRQLRKPRTQAQIDRSNELRRQRRDAERKDHVKVAEVKKVRASKRYAKALATRPTAAPKPVRFTVPAKIRSAWNAASPNSMMRKKFPTRVSLEKHDWSQHAERF